MLFALLLIILIPVFILMNCQYESFARREGGKPPKWTLELGELKRRFKTIKDGLCTGNLRDKIEAERVTGKIKELDRVIYRIYGNNDEPQAMTDEIAAALEQIEQQMEIIRKEIKQWEEYLKPAEKEKTAEQCNQIKQALRDNDFKYHNSAYYLKNKDNSCHITFVYAYDCDYESNRPHITFKGCDAKTYIYSDSSRPLTPYQKQCLQRFKTTHNDKLHRLTDTLSDSKYKDNSFVQDLIKLIHYIFKNTQ